MADIDRCHLHPNRRCQGVDCTQVSDSGGDDGISEDCRARHSRRDFLEHLKPFPAHPVFERGKSGGVPHRLCQACDIAAADRIGDIHEHDWHGSARLLQRPHDRTARSQDDFRGECDQFGRVLTNAIGIAPAPAGIDSQVVAFAPAQFLQPSQKRRDLDARLRIALGQFEGVQRCAASAQAAARAQRAATPQPRRR